MTSSSASDSVFVAGCPLQVATSDHPLTAIVEPERVAVISLPDGVLLAEVGLSDEAEGVDVAWLGSPPRLIVVSRLSDHTLVHMLDVGEHGGGLRLCAEKRVDASLRLGAINGNYGLLTGTTSSASSTAILTRSEDNLSIHPVPARGVPSATGALGSQLVVAFTSVLEIWDPVDRVAKRRLKLPRPTQIRGVGGSDRQIWLTTTPEPQRLEVLPLVNRGQPLAHELPEPIANVASHPKLDIVVCSGADSGRLYVIDLDGRMPTRELSTELFGGRPMAMSMVGGRLSAIVAVAGDKPPRLIGLDGSPIREWPAAPAPLAIHLEPQMPQVPYIGPIATTRAPAPQLSSGGQIGVKPAGASVAAVVPAAPTAAAPAPVAPPPRPSPVYDSKLGHVVSPPATSDEPLPRANILGAATPISRAPRPSTQNEATAPSTSQMIDRLQSWRERGESPAAPSIDTPSEAVTGAQLETQLDAPLDAPADSLPPATRRPFLNAAGTAAVRSDGTAPPPALDADAPEASDEEDDSAFDELNGDSDLEDADDDPDFDDDSDSDPDLEEEDDSASAPDSASKLSAPPAAPREPSRPIPPPAVVPAMPPARPAAAPPAPSFSAPPLGEARISFEASLAAARARSEAVEADWRGTLVEWTRALARKPNVSPSENLTLPPGQTIKTVLDRLELDPILAPVIQILYGNRLLGRDEVSPAEIVTAFGNTLRPDQRWREALGNGDVGYCGAMQLRGSSVRLAGAVRRFLDGHAPKHGDVITDRGANQLPRKSALTFALDTYFGPANLLARTVSSAVGSSVLMVAKPLRSTRALHSASLEATLRHALAVIPYPWPPSIPDDLPAVYLAPTTEIAAATGLQPVTIHP